MKVFKTALLYSALSFLSAVVIGVSLLILFSGGSDGESIGERTEVVFPTAGEVVVAILSGVIIAPILETFIYQSLLLKYLNRYGATKNVAIFVTAVVFSSIHLRNSVTNAILVFIPGIFFCLAYYMYMSDPKRAYLAAALTHAMYNFYYVIGMFIPASYILFWQ